MADAHSVDSGHVFIGKTEEAQWVGFFVQFDTFSQERDQFIRLLSLTPYVETDPLCFVSCVSLLMWSRPEGVLIRRWHLPDSRHETGRRDVRGGMKAGNTVANSSVPKSWLPVRFPFSFRYFSAPSVHPRSAMCLDTFSSEAYYTQSQAPASEAWGLGSTSSAVLIPCV